MSSPHTLRSLLSSRGSESTAPGAPRLTLTEIVSRFWPYLRVYRRPVFAVLALVVLAPLLETATVWMYKVVVDRIVVPHDLGELVPIGGTLALLTIGQSLAECIDDYLASWVAERFLRDLRASVFAHLHRLSPTFFEGRRLGDVVARLTGDVSAIESLMLSGVADGLTYVLRIAMFGAALFILSWQLALAALVVAPVFWLITRHFSREIKAASREKRRSSGAVSAIAEESLANAAVVQAYTRERNEITRLVAQSDAAVTAEMESARLRALFSLLTDGLELAGGMLVLGIGTWQLRGGALSIGAFVAFLAYLAQLYSPIRRLGRLVNTVHAASASAERIIELLDQCPTVADPRVPRPVRRGHGRLVFDGVCFHYPGSARGALRDISLTVAPGETVAVVGSSGAGKSTIAKLALRFYDPDRGRLLIDGVDARDLRLADLRAQIALVLQETLIFHGTIQENIAFGSAEATDEQVLTAARAAGAHEFILKQPEGYRTVVGQRGRRLSGGQRQRIAIARAIVRDAPLLILDEPTTGLDAISAQAVLSPLKRLMQGRAVLVISHDLAAIRDADRIVVIEAGRVREQGTHEELLRLGDGYARLWDACAPPRELIA